MLKLLSPVPNFKNAYAIVPRATFIVYQHAFLPKCSFIGTAAAKKSFKKRTELFKYSKKLVSAYLVNFSLPTARKKNSEKRQN